MTGIEQFVRKGMEAQATVDAQLATCDWPTLEEGAKSLEISVRTMWRHVERGDVEIRKRPLPGRKPANVVNPRDVDKLRPKPHVMPAEREPTAIVSLPSLVLSHGTIDEMAASLARAFAAIVPIQPAPPTAVPIDKKLWLTLDEAVAYGGISGRKLRVAMAEDRLASRPDGPRGATVINRADLERFCSLSDWA